MDARALPTRPSGLREQFVLEELDHLVVQAQFSLKRSNRVFMRVRPGTLDPIWYHLFSLYRIKIHFTLARFT